MRAAGLVILLVSGCIRDDLVPCDDGRVCPAGEVCDLVHEGCVVRDQFLACRDHADRSECSWIGNTGQCFDGVCLRIGCGNHVVEIELSELCDDGNRESHDGCSADCTSLEVCGDGVVDPSLDEECDDGNLQSHDECNSTCQREHEAWNIIGVGPTEGTNGHGAFDEARGRFVYFADGLTWEWAGTAWQLSSTVAPAVPQWFSLVYDSDRQTVVLVGSDVEIAGVRPIDLLWDWNGTAWVPRPSVNIAQSLPGIATYDRGHRRVVVYAGNRTCLLDGATSTWTPFGNNSCAGTDDGVPDSEGRDVSIGYDPGSSRVILMIAGYEIPVAFPDPPIEVPAQTWVLADQDWQNWSSSGASLPAFQATPSLIWDAGRGEFLAVGGAYTTPTGTQFNSHVYSWRSEWTEEFVTSIASARFALAYDTVGSRVFAFGRQNGLGADDDVFVLGPADTTWTTLATGTPHAQTTALVTIDTRRGQLVLVQGTERTETWTWDGTVWQAIAATNAPPFLLGASMAFDPIRDAVVIVDQDALTWLLRDGAWSGPIAGLDSPSNTVFDASRGRLVALARGGVYALASTDFKWTRFATALPPGASTSLAFDARDGSLVAIDSAARQGFAFDGAAWLPALSPTDTSYEIVGDQRRGSIYFVSSTGNLWERSGPTWTDYGRLPLATAGSPLYDPVTGTLIVLGVSGTSRVLVTRRWTSALADETCLPGADADGDGKSECDDDDCWWACMPACPPYVSCP